MNLESFEFKSLFIDRLPVSSSGFHKYTFYYKFIKPTHSRILLIDAILASPSAAANQRELFHGFPLVIG